MFVDRVMTRRQQDSMERGGKGRREGKTYRNMWYFIN